MAFHTPDPKSPNRMLCGAPPTEWKLGFCTACEEAWRALVVEVAIGPWVECTLCSGLGKLGAPGNRFTCPSCDGLGKISKALEKEAANV